MQLEKKKTMSISTKGVMLLDRMVCSVVLRVLQGGFQELYHLDHRIAEEMNQWENNMIYGLECPQGGASLYLQWKDGTLKKVKYASTTYRDAIIRFTSMHMAVLVLTGQIGISGAYALHGFTLKGDIAKSMSFARCVDILESYLFPNLINERIMTAVPKKETSSLLVYVNIIKNLVTVR